MSSDKFCQTTLVRHFCQTKFVTQFCCLPNRNVKQLFTDTLIRQSLFKQVLSTNFCQTLLSNGFLQTSVLPDSFVRHLCQAVFQTVLSNKFCQTLLSNNFARQLQLTFVIYEFHQTALKNISLTNSFKTG